MTATAAQMRMPSDRELMVASFERGEIFEAVFDRHATTIFRYLRRRVGAELAEELAAETFARAFRDRRRFDARSASALPWLYGIAANLARMHWRTEERRLRAYARAADPDVEHGAHAAADNRVDADAVRSALSDALATLPPNQREVLLLHAWAELSHAEIAAALRITAGVVRSRLHRARTHVAERLERSGNEPDGNTIRPAP